MPKTQQRTRQKGRYKYSSSGVLKEWGADTLPGGARCDGDKKNVADLSLVSESSLRSEMQRAGLTQTNQKQSFVSDPPIETESYHLNASCTYASVYKINCRDNSGIHGKFSHLGFVFNLDLNSSGESARLFFRA